MIGGRYGSISPEGISYTEQEFDYAVYKGIKIVALLHESPDDIPLGKSEKDPGLRERLREFREKASDGRLVKFWKSAEELPGLVALSLSKTIKAHPARGWVRADRVANEEVLNELNQVRKQNEVLVKEISDLKPAQETTTPDLAGLHETIRLSGTHYFQSKPNYTWSQVMTWAEIFSCISPYLVQHPNDAKVKKIICSEAFSLTGKGGTTPSLNDQVFQTISVQLRALGLVNVRYLKNTEGGMGLFWSATPAGEKLMYALRTIKSQPENG